MSKKQKILIASLLISIPLAICCFCSVLFVGIFRGFDTQTIIQPEYNREYWQDYFVKNKESFTEFKNKFSNQNKYIIIKLDTGCANPSNLGCDYLGSFTDTSINSAGYERLSSNDEFVIFMRKNKVQGIKKLVGLCNSGKSDCIEINVYYSSPINPSISYQYDESKNLFSIETN